MRTFLVFIIISCILLLYCAGSASDYFDNFLSKVITNQNDAKIELDFPGRPMGIDSSSFNLEKYFEAFDKLEIKNGYRLDFFYYRNLYAGYPVFLILKADEDLNLLISPFNIFDTFPVLNNEKYTFKSYSKELFDEFATRRNFSNFIKAENSKEGFFQLLSFYLIGEAFGLWWHGRNNLNWIICSTHQLDQLISLDIQEVRLSPGQVAKARQIELKPKIALSGDFCQIEITTFDPWKGFTRKNYKINRTFPHSIELLEERIMLEYNCEIDY